MFTFDANDDDVLQFGRKFRRYTKKHLELAFNDIKRDWIADIRFQQRNGRSLLGWPPLSEEYGKRKQREYNEGKIPYNSLLRRTGRLLDGYISGIEIDLLNNSITMPYPQGQEQKAGSHQLGIGNPQRAFDVERFYEIAQNRLDKVYDKINDE